MHEKYKNIFWHQGIKEITDNQQTKNQKEIEKYDQLENDITKALINLLEHSDSYRIKQAFFNLIDNRIRFKQEAPVFSFQSYSEEDAKNGKLKRAELKFPVSLRSKFFTKEVNSEYKTKNPRPDAFISGKNFAVLIESKTKASYSKKQIEKYSQKFFGEKLEIRDLFWEDLFEKFKGLSKIKSIGKKDGFLLSQFLEYLEVIGLSGFQGISFEKRGDWNAEDAKDILIKLMIEIEGDLKKRKLEYTKRSYKGEKIWQRFALNELIQNDGLAKGLHYSVYIYHEFFGVDVIVQKGKLMTLLRNAIKNDEQKLKFIGILNRLKKKKWYFLEAADYPIINKKGKGPQSGATYDAVKLGIELKKIPTNNKFLQNFMDMCKLTRDIKLIRKIPYENKEYESKIRKSRTCKELFLETVDDVNYPPLKWRAFD